MVSVVDERLLPALQSLVCPVCLNLAWNACITPCDHVFCRPCLTAALGRAAECPLDRQPIRERDVEELSREGRKLLNDQVVYCLHARDGCDWKGQYGDLKAHLRDGCPRTVVACPFKKYGCEIAWPRGEMDMHLRASTTPHLAALQKSCELLEKTLDDRDRRLDMLERACVERNQRIEELAVKFKDVEAKLKESATIVNRLENELSTAYTRAKEAKAMTAPPPAAAAERALTLMHESKDRYFRTITSFIESHIKKQAEDNPAITVALAKSDRFTNVPDDVWNLVKAHYRNAKTPVQITHACGPIWVDVKIDWTPPKQPIAIDSRCIN